MEFEERASDKRERDERERHKSVVIHVLITFPTQELENREELIGSSRSFSMMTATDRETGALFSPLTKKRRKQPSLSSYVHRYIESST